MPKKKFNLGDWCDEHLGWIVLTIVLTLFGIIASTFIIYNKYANDYLIYEDNQIICYSDDGTNDTPNSKQRYYCVDRNTRAKVCEYGYSRGSGNKPPQGCYL